MRVLIAAIIGLVLGAVVIAATGYSPVEAYSAMFREAFGTPESIAAVLGKSTPLILVGLAFLVSYSAGLFNIGVEGQFTVGGLAAVFVGSRLSSLPWWGLVPAVAVAGALAGAVWAGLAGWMKAARNVHEVVSTIMLNYIALGLGTYLINIQYGPLHNPAADSPQSVPIGAGAHLPNLVARTDLSAGVFVAFAMVPAVWWLLRRSVIGFEIRAVGRNPLAARTYGIREARVIVRSMLYAGAIAGLAGALELMGVFPYLYKSGFSGGRGFDAITIALMGGGTPVGALFAAIFLGALRLGASGMETLTGVPNELSLIVQGILIIAVTAPTLAEWVQAWRKGREEPAAEGSRT